MELMMLRFPDFLSLKRPTLQQRPNPSLPLFSSLWDPPRLISQISNCKLCNTKASVKNLQSSRPNQDNPDDTVRDYFLRLDKAPPHPQKPLYNCFHWLSTYKTLKHRFPTKNRQEHSFYRTLHAKQRLCLLSPDLQVESAITMVPKSLNSPNSEERFDFDLYQLYGAMFLCVFVSDTHNMSMPASKHECKQCRQNVKKKVAYTLIISWFNAPPTQQA